MPVRYACDGCECPVSEADATPVGRIEKLLLCAACHAKHVALQAVLDSKQVEVAAVFERFQREAREASGLKAVPDA